MTATAGSNTASNKLTVEIPPDIEDEDTRADADEPPALAPLISSVADVENSSSSSSEDRPILSRREPVSFLLVLFFVLLFSSSNVIFDDLGGHEAKS